MSRPKPNIILEAGEHDIYNSFFVYELYDETKKEPFYVGKAAYPHRPYEHIEEAYGTRISIKNRHKLNTIKKIVKENHNILIKIVFSSTDEQSALDEEIRLIALYGRKDLKTGILTNMTNGGDGITGHIHSQHSRKKISEALKNRPKEIRRQAAEKIKGHTFNKGRILSEEHKNKISKANMGRKIDRDITGENNPFYNKNHSEISKEKMSIWKSENYKGENNPFYGKNHSTESKQKISKNNINQSLYELISPKNEVYYIYSYQLDNFCVENNLNKGSLKNSCLENRSYKGWLIKKTKININKEKYLV
jgi:hypothetical protein